MNPKYNFIYAQLVQGEDDLIGLIAYGIYKKHKIEFITQIKKEFDRDPTDEECQSFSAATNTESQLNSYRSQAETMLSEAVGNIAGEEINRFEKEMLRDYKDTLSSCIPSGRKSFWLSLFAGVVSTFLFSLIAGLFFFLGETSEKNTKEYTRQLLDQFQELPNREMEGNRSDK